MGKLRGATRAEDEVLGYYEEGVITKVEPYSDGEGWSVSWGDCWGCGVRDVGVEPKVGDTLRVYGEVGYPFHGQDLNGQSLWYLTPEDEEVERQKALQRHEQEKREKFEQERPRLDAAYDALPGTFKERIDKFRQTNPSWRWEFESYEMMCCVDAVKIAEYCRSVKRLSPEPAGVDPSPAENVETFAKLPFEEQNKAGVSDEHSANSFSFAVRLAYLWVTEPSMVVAEHGALTPLVGCERYGCPHPTEAP